MLDVQLNEQEKKQLRNLATGYHGQTLRKYLQKLMNSFDLEDITEETFLGYKLAKKIIKEDLVDVLDRVIKDYPDQEQGGDYE